MITLDEVKEILANEYHIDNFTYLIKELLLPDFVGEKHDVSFSSEIFTTVKQLGDSVACKLSVFEVVLKDGAQNRRVAITQEMFKVLRGLRINNAVVAFTNADKRNFRISLLTSKYEYDGEKIVKVLSNPRRYSYSLGLGTKTKTAYKFLIAKGKVTDLNELINRFSVEVVNKQFYSEVATSFTELVGGERDGKTYEKLLNLHGSVDHNKYAEFGVRLIGRIVFCWFLREKRSENNIPLVPDDMLALETIREKANYYHDALEPLFFELLNTSHKKRKACFNTDYYKLIPYLNGGLFSPHIDDRYKFDSVNNCGLYGAVTIPNEWFIKFYNTLGQYNFTVDENTAYDIELSIDPEMLGRIFENLLAEINPETGENAKKSTGSFYTPRDIVDFMVDSSLCEYLKTKTGIDGMKLNALISYSKDDDNLAVFNEAEKKKLIDALYTVTVLDPACGSGAFPIGMLQKVVYVLQEIDPTANLWFDKATENVGILLKKEFEKKFNAGSLNYIRKLSVIQNSIFGIDIQPIAVEISRLRCFLSLIIEEKVDDTEENRGINPLPNLDFKFIIANSLITLDNTTQLSIFENQDHIKILKDIREEYFNADSERRTELKLEFLQVQQDMLLNTIANYQKQASARYQQLSEWKPFENQATSWFDADWMFGIKDGFDIIIANPPYIDSENMMNSGMGGLRDYISNKYKYCKGNWDIYIAFFERSFNLLNETGSLIFITPDKWISRPFGEKLRTSLLYHIKSIYQSGRDVFDSALVDSIVTTITKQKSPILITIRDKDKEKVINTIDKSYFLKVNILDIAFSDYFEFIAKVEKDAVPLSEYAVCENACATSDCYKLKEILDQLDSYEEFDNTYLKIINTGTIGRFVPRWGYQEMKYLKDKYLYPVVDKTRFLEYFPNSYGEKSLKRKIIIKGLTLLDACIDLKGEIIPGKSTMVIPAPEGTLYLLMGIINSKLMIFYVKQKYASSSYNGGINFTKDMINNLPIKQHIEALNKITALSKEITRLKIDDILSDTVELEMQIDNIMYSMYDLTEEEIAVVEATIK